MMADFDIIFVGGGLATCIAARRLADGANLKILIIEKAEQLGGEHTWCFHEQDLNSNSDLDWLESLVDHSWTGYTVKFPGLCRDLAGRYFCIRSKNIDQKIRALDGVTIIQGTATTITDDLVTCSNGDEYRGRLVLDSRPHRAFEPVGFQKFMGMELVLSENHSFKKPILMDATVPQTDGFRFMYVLPLAPNRVLIEDTYYSNTTHLSSSLSELAILTYAKQIGLRVEEVVDQEFGCLALPPLHKPVIDRHAFGYRAELFHPTTGYSLAEAVRFANWLSTHVSEPAAKFYQNLDRYRLATYKHGHFFARLNAMLFLAGDPSNRWRVLARFYRLPAASIARFYAGRLLVIDQLRLLIGKPPVPLMQGIRSFFRAPTAGINYESK